MSPRPNKEHVHTRRVALIDRHGTEEEHTPVRAGSPFELHGEDGFRGRFINRKLPRGRPEDCGTAILKLIHDEGGVWSPRDLVDRLSGDFGESTVRDAAWDLVNENGVLVATGENPACYRANQNTAWAYDELDIGSMDIDP